MLPLHWSQCVSRHSMILNGLIPYSSHQLFALCGSSLTVYDNRHHDRYSRNRHEKGDDPKIWYQLSGHGETTNSNLFYCGSSTFLKCFIVFTSSCFLNGYQFFFFHRRSVFVAVLFITQPKDCQIVLNIVIYIARYPRKFHKRSMLYRTVWIQRHDILQQYYEADWTPTYHNKSIGS